MATRTVTLNVTGTTAEAQAALAELGLVADDTSSKIGDKLGGAGEKAAGGFSKLGQAIQNFTGIPVAPFIDSMASKFEGLDTKGQRLTQTMSTLGGITMAAGVAGFVAAGVEAIHMADSFDTAQSSLQTAVKNSGNSWKAFSAPIDDAYGKMAKLGFNSTETAGALTQLTTATGSPKKAIDDLGVAADLARLKHISLSDASGILTKTLAGSTRGLTSLGINLDIGSAKLSSMHGASVALQGAQLTLKETQEKVADGSLKGVAAQQALENANRGVSVASQNLARDQQAGGDIMDAIKKKTEGAADTYGKTLPGQMAIAQAETHDLGVKFGEFLVPKITEAIGAVTSLIGWFEKHEGVAKVLAGVIGTVLGGAMITFATTKAISFGKSITGMAKDMGKLATTILEKVGIINTANASMADSSEEAGAEMEASASGVEASETALADTSEAAGITMDSALGPIGLVLAGIGIAAMLLASHWKQIWNGIKEVVGDVVDFIKSHWQLLLAIILGPIGLVIDGFVHFHDQIIGFFADIIDWIKSHWELLVEILGGPVGVAFAAWQHFHDQIIQVFDDIWHAIDHVWSAIEQDTLGAVDTVVGFFTALPGRVISGLGDIGGQIESAFVTAVSSVQDNVVTPVLKFFEDLPGNIMDALKGLADDFLHLGESLAKAILSGIGNLGGDIVHAITSHIPGGGLVSDAAHAIFGAAEGGVVTKPTLLMVGEAGYPEAIVPLKNGLSLDAPGPLSMLGAGNSPALTTLGSGNGGGITTGVGGAADGGGDLVLQMNGSTLARVAGPDLRSWLLQRKRGTGTLGIA